MIVHRQFLGHINKKSLPSAKRIKKVVEAVLKRERASSRGEVNIIFVDNKIIKKINNQFLNKNKLTDVIAFPYFIKNKTEDDSPLGDVYISLTVAMKNAKKFNQTLHRELTRLVVHGMLHLLGYTDSAPQEKKKMWTRQEALVQSLC